MVVVVAIAIERPRGMREVSKAGRPTGLAIARADWSNTKSEKGEPPSRVGALG